MEKFTIGNIISIRDPFNYYYGEIGIIYEIDTQCKVLFPARGVYVEGFYPSDFKFIYKGSRDLPVAMMEKIKLGDVPISMEIDYKTKFKNILELNAQWLESDIPLGDKLSKLGAVISGSDYCIDKSNGFGFTIREHPQWTPAPDNPDVIRTTDDKAEWDMEKSENNPVPEKTNEIIFPGKIEDLTDEIWNKAQMESLKKRGFEFFEGGLYVLDKDGKRTATITKEGYKSIND